ncbi:MAG TPA: hypothetical protein VIL38_05530 [Thermaerobacter sp.]
MRRIWSAAAMLLVLSLLLVSCGAPDSPGARPGDDPQQEAPDPAAGDEAAVRSVVEAFGRQLQQVSLLAPEDEVRRSMEKHYAGYVAPELLAAWQADPLNAPGRTVSSPWPDRIEITSVKALPDGGYQVEGTLIEVTSVEQGTDEAAATRPITLVLRRFDGRWLITEVTLGDYEQAGGVNFTSQAYGFRLALPGSWQGYTVVTEVWEGRALEDAADGSARAGDVVERGPLLRIRHPQWTAERPRQDIPIMVFTLAQWEALQQGTISVGAAPVPPGELGRNNAYVLALPARYNYEFPEGYEEVEEILAGDPLEPFDLSAGQVAAAEVLASLAAPEPPAAALLEREAGTVARWFTALEMWMQEAVLVPNALAEQGAAADQGVRDLVRETLTAYFSADYAERLLAAYWEPETREQGQVGYRLLETEGPAILPFMTTVELAEASRSRVVIHAATPPPAMWEDVTRTYHLVWPGSGDSFRIESIDTEGW